MKRFYVLFTAVALLFAGLTSATVVRAENSPAAILHAQGSGYHTDFVAASSKRADLRLNVAKKGLDAAFTEWLQAERSGAYRQAAPQATTSAQSTAAVQSAAANCCQKDGQCCKANCSQCCAKGSCRMACCEMKPCKTVRLSCCK